MQRVNARYWTRRILRHLLLGVLAAAVTWLPFRHLPDNLFRVRVTTYSAFASLALLTISLSLGPWNLLREKPNPVSFDLRRDIGIWAGILAIFHTCVGLTVHLRGRMWMYFLRRLHPPAVQNTMFGFANYTGLAGALLFLGLIFVSNDFSLRRLGARRWKSFQRWTYAAAILSLVHGAAYFIVVKRRGGWIVLLATIAGAAFVLQIAGILHKRSLARPRDV